MEHIYEGQWVDKDKDEGEGEWDEVGGEAQNISEQQITQGEGDFSIVQVFFICGTQYLDPSRQDSGGDTIVLGGYCQRGS